MVCASEGNTFVSSHISHLTSHITMTTIHTTEFIDDELTPTALSQISGAGLREWWAQRPKSAEEVIDTAIDFYLGDTAKTISSNTRRQQGDTGVYSPPDQEGSDDPYVIH